MKKIRVIWYTVKQGIKNIAKNFFMVMASVLVVFAVLVVLGSLLLTSKNLQSVMKQFSDRAEVQINFDYEVTQEEAEKMMAAIGEDPRVESIVLIPKEENLNRILEYFSEERDLFEAYKDSEKLQFITLEISLNEFANGEEFVEEAKMLSGVDNVQDIVNTINKMEVVSFWLKIGGIIALVILLFISIMLIFNTVKLTVFARKREIEIMKYIGATDSYICSPFIIEGVITGIIGAVVSFIADRAIYNLIFNSILKSGILGNVSLLSFQQAGGLQLFISFIAFGIISGLVASYWAVARYANV